MSVSVLHTDEGDFLSRFLCISHVTKDLAFADILRFSKTVTFREINQVGFEFESLLRQFVKSLRGFQIIIYFWSSQKFGEQELFFV